MNFQKFSTSRVNVQSWAHILSSTIRQIHRGDKMSVLFHTYPCKPRRKINVAISDHQVGSPFFVWCLPWWCVSTKKETLNVLTETMCHWKTQTIHQGYSNRLFVFQVLLFLNITAVPVFCLGAIYGYTALKSRYYTLISLRKYHHLNLRVLVTTIDAQWEGMGDVGLARYEPALLLPCPTIRVLSYSNEWIFRNSAL